jgi:dienelactone hydrolase
MITTMSAVSESVVHPTIAAGVIRARLLEPSRPRGLVFVIRATGSRRQCAADEQTARALAGAGFSTMLVNLLTDRESELDAETSEFRFDFDLIARRLISLVRWTKREGVAGNVGVGWVVSGLAVAAAVEAAARHPELVSAVVARAGRPDLAGPALRAVRAPTLLIVGERDTHFGSNAAALAELPAGSCLDVIDGAYHSLDDEEFAPRLAARTVIWFEQTLAPEQPATAEALW